MKGNRSLRPPCTDIERRQIEDIEMAVRDLGDALPPRRGSDDLISDDLILLDRGAVGCRGVLVVRRTGQLICLGSHCGAEEFAWAYHRGIPIDDANATSTLIITSVADHERVERLLRMFLRADYVRREVVPELAKMPLVLPGVMLYFVIPDLKEAVEEGWFEFEIEHSGEAPPNVASTRSPFRE